MFSDIANGLEPKPLGSTLEARGSSFGSARSASASRPAMSTSRQPSRPSIAVVDASDDETELVLSPKLVDSSPTPAQVPTGLRPTRMRSKSDATRGTILRQEGTGKTWMDLMTMSNGARDGVGGGGGAGAGGAGGSGGILRRNTARHRQRGWSFRRTTKSSTKTAADIANMARDCDVIEYTRKELNVISVTSTSEIVPMAAKLKLGVTAPAGQTAYWVQMKTANDFAFGPLLEALGVDQEAVQAKLQQEGRPSVSDTEDHVTVVSTHFVQKSLEGGDSMIEKCPCLSIVCTNVLFTICDSDDLTKAVIAKLRQVKGVLRQTCDTSLLFQALISTTIDRNYGVVEQLGDRLALIEEEVLEKLPKESVATLQKANIAGRVHAIKRELFELRNVLWPLRETLSQLTTSTTMSDGIISDRSKAFLLRNKNSCLQLINIVETYRELGTSLIELFTAQGRFMLDKQTKFLAMWSFIFLPTTFLSGVYGMNFYNYEGVSGSPQMWEIHHKYGYPLFWAICAAYLFFAICFFHHQRFIKVGSFTKIKAYMRSKPDES